MTSARAFYYLIFLVLLSCSPREQVLVYDVNQNAQSVIYGPDSRIEVTKLRGKALENSARVAAIVDSRFVKEVADSKTYSLAGLSLIRAKSMCTDERFSDQMAVARCSAVLVTPTRMLTAGHCIQNQEQCEKSTVVFKFTHSEEASSDAIVQSEQVFKCKRLLRRKQAKDDDDDSQDFAIFEVDRAVDFATPVNLQFTNDLQPGLEVYTLGHSLGLPMKYADGKVLTNKSNDNMFRADIDAFSGNSGSPVFNLNTHAMIGIFIGGEEDLIIDSNQNCRVAKQCHDSDCKGELILKLSRIRKIFDNIPH